MTFYQPLLQSCSVTLDYIRMRAFFKRPKLKYIDCRTYTCNPVQCLRHNSVTKVVLYIRFVNIVLCWQLSISMWKAVCLFVVFSVFKGKAVQPNPSTVGQERLWTEAIYTSTYLCSEWTNSWQMLPQDGRSHPAWKVMLLYNFYKESKWQIPIPVRFITIWW